MKNESTAFVDTNILLYMFDAGSPVKQGKARSLVREDPASLTISSQVAQEFAAAAPKLQLGADDIARVMEPFAAFSFVPVQIAIVQRAVLCAKDNQISFWDALIVEAAAEAKCKVLWTEDLNHGQTISGVKIRNPFG